MRRNGRGEKQRDNFHILESTGFKFWIVDSQWRKELVHVFSSPCKALVINLHNWYLQPYLN